MRIWNGGVKVVVPPLELASPAVGFVYWYVRDVGTAVIAKVPL